MIFFSAFSSTSYIPHGHCYLWQTPLVGLHLVSDLLIAIAYYSIPIMLLYFVFKRKDVPFQGIFIMFGLFIILCGTGHLLEIWTLWHPAYWLSGTEQALTALVSCYTAVEMATLLPRFLSLKTPEQLEIINRELQKEIAERQKAENELRQINERLEARVEERTTKLDRSAEREETIATIIQKMRQTLDLKTIFADTTEAIRKSIACERVLVYQFKPDWSGRIVAEAVAAGWDSLICEADNTIVTKVAIEDDKCAIKTIKDTYLQETQNSIFSQKDQYRAVVNIYEANFDRCYLELLEAIQAKAYLVVPIFCGDHLYGLLFAYQLSAPRQWDSAVIKIMTQVGTQLGVAVQQAELLAYTQQQARELSVAKNEAERASKAKSEFLSNMSHELRTPLNAILGYAQLMKRSNQLAPDHQKYIETIDRSGEHLLGLINSVLEMSKIEAGYAVVQSTSFDLYNLLDELQDLLALKAQLKGLQLSFDLYGDVPQYIKSDRNKPRQVLINLLGNSLKFTETGKVELTVELEAQLLYFSVTDTGTGISPEEIDRIFDAFRQAEAGLKATEGTGLGLAISRQFVELMGGEISVSSELGAGTTITFTIPLIASDSISDSTVARLPAALAPNQAEVRILVAEDNPVNLELMLETLSAVGFQVRGTVNGREAIAVWETWEPHGILMDMKMPVVNGCEATRQIKASARGKTTKIIALTASVFAEERQQILSFGCDDFVRKPFSFQELFEKIARHLQVQYIYREERDSRNSVREHLAVLDAESLKVMPPEWLEAVYQRASEGDDLQLLELVKGIPTERQQLAERLTALVEEFKFDEIIELTGAAPSKANG